ncbi:hypothetical protein [Helicobacter zhangjianzhongii]|uniref:Uncharacterized protein n=1 Tax=Helicobacter zhangjianzhongii TaxID=2974574 RepID=A0ACC6FQL5_9HELI|nr:MULTISPECIES: hypothetical protein [unclassified Helicobacter]MDL0079678.1 hypothetical protein [Helicobacter sp. CPD2-1]MDL0081425.1 hypothetical protein [Helicobacter sp. XJK30-2]
MRAPASHRCRWFWARIPKRQEKVDSSNATNLKKQAQDFRIFTQNAPILTTPQAAGFEMKNCSFQGVGTQAGFFSKSAQNKRSAVSLEKPTPFLRA